MKHLLLLISVLLMMVAAVPVEAQSFHIGGHKAVHDNYYGIWLCSVPQELFGTTWDTTVQLDSTWTDITIDGISVTDGSDVTFADITGGKNYPITATVDGTPLSGNITFTWLPVLELNGEFGYDYVEGAVSVNASDTSGLDDLRAKLKWRGNNSNTEGKHKRNYSIKFLGKNGGKKNRSLLGLRKDNHWKLDGGQADLLRIRNRVTTDLWLDMARKPWYSDVQAGVVNGSRGRITEVILNGSYLGLYNLMEPIDRKQLGLVKHDTIANEFHGQLWCVKHWCRTATMSNPLPWSNDSATWDGMEVSYPDFEEVHPTDWSTLANAITFIKQTDADDKWIEHDDSLGMYFDLPVMQDYFIFIVVMQLIDNESKNLYYSTWDKAESRLLTITPWDLNMSVGAQSITYLPPEAYRPERPLNWISHLPMYAMYHISKKNRKQMTDRYWQLRQTLLDADSLVARFQHAVDELELCGAAAREETRWSGDSDLDGQTLDISAEMAYIDDWIHRRMDYLDKNVFARLQGDVNGDDEVNVADINGIINDILAGNNAPDYDVNGDGEVNVADVNTVIDIIFK